MPRLVKRAFVRVPFAVWVPLVTALAPLAAFSQSASSVQKEASVSLQTYPKQLTLAGGESQRILAVISITGDGSIRNLKLTPRFGSGVWVSVGKTPEIPDGFHGDLTWPVSVTKADDGRASSDVTLQASYTSGAPPDVREQSAFTTFTITLKARPKAEDVVVGTLDASFTKLQERRPQTVYLTLSNVSDVPVTVLSIAASLPGFASIRPANTGPILPDSGDWTSLPLASGTSVIQPRQELVVTYELEVKDNEPVDSGTYLLLFRTEVLYKRDGYATHATVLAKKEFQGSVLGEEEFVGITAVPFLTLPGFIFITAWAILLSRFWPRWQISLDYKKPEYYFLSVLSSFAFVFLYPEISHWIYAVLWRTNQPSRDILSGYSLADIVNVWLLAICAAVVPWMVGFGMYALIHRFFVLLQTKKVPQPGDSPEIVLEKLERAHKRVDLNQVTVAGAERWEVPLPSPDPTQRWVSGRIEVSFVAGAKTDQLEGDLTTAMADPKSLREFLAGHRKELNARWEPDGPRLVDKKDAPQKPGGAEDFIHITE